ncbi:hypothetical protein PQJ75_08035 [Rhodoplanes sp. TEM]|uniref:Uncharacterized protein n=1 Tax=Rhodoplanes tepidamans TaxID=200616 RepID=A0ABT5J3R4_RHOTP|nr:MULTISPECIES: hypothetical protein [Rhodoplanes]MDC7784284.1 hypothetical protein [Rhodoplanes tepidamans]MDC7983676.1 hypothetical protein [Rhodoplanes sp. TEM]MDQ0353686.1 hypothetical protein [Rhodoplanes tepidamans]
MFRRVLRSLAGSSGSSDPIAGRFKIAPLFVPAYRSGLSIRINARPPRQALARRRLGRLIETRRRSS